MKLRKILKLLGKKDNISFRDINIKGLAVDSREVKDDFLFVALRGNISDGHNFIQNAIGNGAKAIILKDLKYIDRNLKNIIWIKCKNTDTALKRVANSFYAFPKDKLKLFGITGTNGKTTITYLLEKIFSRRLDVGVIGTIDCHYKAKAMNLKNTTPGFLDIQKILYEMYRSGVKVVSMEVSSHALKQGRVEGLNFECGVFTNLTPEHLDYHKNMQDYFLSKQKLFTSLKKDSFAIINRDDFWGKKLVCSTKAKIITYGLKKANIFASQLKMDLDGIDFIANFNDSKIRINSSLIGRHNVYNILAAIGVAVSQKIPVDDIRKGISALNSVCGRLQKIDKGQNFKVFVDYAHTPDALEKVISALNDFKKKRLILVFGCGGDRDRIKRPKMGDIASRLCDFTIITSDNPRSEDPQIIASEIKNGFRKSNFVIELDRARAIEKALNLAKKDDIVLVCGKGHETSQIFKDKIITFSDQRAIECLL